MEIAIDLAFAETCNVAIKLEKSRNDLEQLDRLAHGIFAKNVDSAEKKIGRLDKIDWNPLFPIC